VRRRVIVATQKVIASNVFPSYSEVYPARHRDFVARSLITRAPSGYRGDLSSKTYI